MTDRPAWVEALLSLNAEEYRLWSSIKWRQGDNECAWPAQTRIAEDLSRTPRAVRDIARRLQDKGWLLVEWPGGPGRGHACRYSVCCPEKRDGGSSSAGQNTGTTVPLLPTKKRNGGSSIDDQKSGTAIPLLTPEKRNGGVAKRGTVASRHKGRTLTGTLTGRARTFVPPSVDEVAAYADSLGDPDFPAERFVTHYADMGWRHKHGGPMKDWRGTVRTWWRRDNEARVARGEPPHDGYSQFGTHPATEAEVAKLRAQGVFG